MTKTNNLVVLVLGSKSDLAWAQRIGKHLREFHLPYTIRIASAHKSPEHAVEIIKEYEGSNKNIIFIAIAGRSNALGGFLDAHTHLPVVNCPPYCEKYAGLDILSSLRMPSGIATPTVLEADHAALFALKIFALSDRKSKIAVDAYHKDFVRKIKADDASI